SSDPSDFLNSPASNLTPNDPFDESIAGSTLTSVDLTLMDVLGFNVTSSPPPPPPPATSDLVPENIALGSSSVAAGGSLTVNWDILNQGTAAANASSTTEVRITSSPTSAAGTNLVGVSTSALAAGASQAESANLTVPTTPGTYYVWVIADNFTAVSNQSNTTNDLQHSASFTVAPVTQLYDFEFLYKDWQTNSPHGNYYLGTVADNGTFGYHAGQIINTPLG